MNHLVFLFSPSNGVGEATLGPLLLDILGTRGEHAGRCGGEGGGGVGGGDGGIGGIGGTRGIGGGLGGDPGSALGILGLSGSLIGVWVLDWDGVCASAEKPDGRSGSLGDKGFVIPSFLEKSGGGSGASSEQ